MLTYCTRCVMPSTKPDLVLDEAGVCNACRAYEARGTVDWGVRRSELEALLERYRQHGRNWDAIVPVSGGKDSTYQVIRILQLGLNPLCVTATTCDLSSIGRKNIDNIKRLGVDYVEFSPNPLVRATLNRIGLTEVGDISWPEHVGIFTIPVRAAVQFNVPLIVWGENSQNEYGGPAAAAKDNVLTRRWLEEFGGLLGLRVSDLSGSYGIEPRHLLPYQYPSDEELKRVGVTGLFLGHYLPWDGLSNALIAQANGFMSFGRPIEGSMVDYENIDNHQTGIHDYFKFLKFGFARATDIACLHVRRGRITRGDALQIVKARDGKFPWSYLGKPLDEILEPLDMSVEEFVTVCDRFTNKKVFRRDGAGALIKDRRGNLKKTNYDNPVNVGVINYGMGNLGSVRRALEDLGVDVTIADDPAVLNHVNRIILPGVGAFGEGMTRLRAGGWIDALRSQVMDGGKPLMGICLGMQMLASSSEEKGFNEGLGFVSGRVRRLDALGCSLRIPHVGWNDVRYREDATLFNGIPQATDFYFVHSFALDTDDDGVVCATTTYGMPVAAAIQQGRLFATQFHPEKSSTAGRQVLKNFLDVPAC